MAQEDGREGTPYDGLQVYERVGISLVEVHDKVEKSLILVCTEGSKRAKRWIFGFKKSRKHSGFLIDSQSIYSSLKGCKVVNYTPIQQVCERGTILNFGNRSYTQGVPFFMKNGI